MLWSSAWPSAGPCPTPDVSNPAGRGAAAHRSRSRSTTPQAAEDATRPSHCQWQGPIQAFSLGELCLKAHHRLLGLHHDAVEDRPQLIDHRQVALPLIGRSEAARADGLRSVGATTSTDPIAGSREGGPWRLDPGLRQRVPQRWSCMQLHARLLGYERGRSRGKKRERGRKVERESPPSEAVEEEVRRGHGGRRVGIGRAITSQLLLA